VSSATLHVGIDPANGPLVVRDAIVITNQTTVSIPDSALLAYDTPPSGHDQAITGISNATGATVTHSTSSASVTFAADSSSSHSFDYTDTSGSVSNTAHVTVTENASANLTGTWQNEILIGGAGNDNLNGGAGNDTLIGGTGNNTLTGGTGADTFVISNGGHDTIMDYSKTDGDKVDISSVLNTSAGDHLEVIKNADGSVKLDILNSSNVEKASVSFENIHFSDLTPGHELDSLLGKVDVHHS
jgi:Ca2+-binding RTX toxin-like protein